MGKTFSTGLLTNGVFQDASNNVGIGAAPSGTYKFEVTGTAKVSGILTLSSTISNGTYTYTLPSATGTLALTSSLSSYLPLIAGTANKLTGDLYINKVNSSLVFQGNTTDALIYNNGSNLSLVDNATGLKGLTLNVSTGAATFSENVLLAATKRLYLSGTSYITEITAGTIRLAPAGNDSFDITSSLLNVWVPSVFDSTVKVNGTAVATSGILTVKTSSSTLGATADLGLLISNDGAVGKMSQIGFGYSESRCGAVIGGIITNGGGSTSSALFFATRDSTDGTIPPTERMRITSVGFTKISNSGAYFTANNVHEIRSNTSNDYDLILSNTSASPYGVYITYPNASPNSGSTNEFLVCGDSNNTKLFIFSNGTVLNRTGSYGTISSDIRLKENIVEANSKLNDLLKLRVVNFNLIDDTDKKKQIGFIAQEFKEVFPSLVYEKDTREYDKDGNVTKGLEDSLGLNVGMEFAILVKAIQELNEKLIRNNIN